jgi:hypothetical protein
MDMMWKRTKETRGFAVLRNTWNQGKNSRLGFSNGDQAVTGFVESYYEETKRHCKPMRRKAAERAGRCWTAPPV